MTKKEYILRVLDAVKNTRDMAPGLKILVESDVIDDKVIDTLVTLFREAADKTTNQKAKSALQKTADMIGNLHQQEESDHEKDLADLAELESMFKDL